MGSVSCGRCRELSEAVQEALRLQLRVIAHLQEATIEADLRARAAVQSVIWAARRSRQEAFQRFQEHLLTHQAATT